MTPLRPLSPLLLTAGILLAGNGVQGTMIALRGTVEGFSTVLIGVMGTAYFAGFMAGCLAAPRLVRTVGHIRVFAGLAAAAVVGTLSLLLFPYAWAWVVIRLMMGFCFSGLFTVIESWLNAQAESGDRGRVLSIYRIIDLGAVTGAQYLLPVFPPAGFELFAVVAMLFALSIMPVAIADRSRPSVPARLEFDLKAIWTISPLACLGCVTIGLTTSAFRLIGPLYAQEMGLGIAQVATFMGAGIVGGAALQYPLGLLSDRFDRRWTLLLATLGAALAGAILSAAEPGVPALLYLGIFLFGAFALPLYSLSAAHANDMAEPGDFVLVAAGLTFFFSLGAMVGPPAASYVLATFGAPAMFAYTSAVHAAFIAVALWRIFKGRVVPGTARTRFVPLLRTSPAIFRLARQRALQAGDGKKGGENHSGSDIQDT